MAQSPKREGFRFPTPEVPPEIKSALRAAFDEIDTNKDGRIDQDELHQGLKKSGHTFSKRVIKRMMMFQLYQHNEVKIGALSFEQFVGLSGFLNMMKGSFDSLDGDKNGTIDDKEMGRGLLDLGLPVKADQIKLLMAVVDADNNGTVEFAEYVDLAFYLIFFSYISDSLSKKNVESFAPEVIQDLCGLAGVEVSDKDVNAFIEKSKGRVATFQDLLGLLVIAQVSTK
eukprot:CAMPEP_0201515068 /NCGR_PEP_ID=MMETSP0161_2-20130828/6732_1 /ASSEMBLY_ACC=CAM_ASM_000251 /TAXON_ID=180227 /ORGANISM="Neoparamoeba aestuarina, Strain SoJaBio B1-5/56/2" /LENGTH=226 /DNA_ID=CAMNT_0047911787 /DNA_START=104 /DNA_END=784 /DNA_ORIENTATION=+